MSPTKTVWYFFLSHFVFRLKFVKMIVWRATPLNRDQTVENRAVGL